MTSKIINMAERMKDEKDRLLESMFVSEPIADDGFSKQVIRRVRRKLFLRRLTLPVAALIGGIIAFKPTIALLGVLIEFSKVIPQDMLDATAIVVPQLPMLVLGAMLLATCLVGLRALED